MKKGFTWNNFDVPFLQAILYSEKTKKTIRPGYQIEDKDGLIPRMNMLCHQPDDHFVRRYREEIADHFLSGSTHLVSLMQALEKRRYRGVRVADLEQMLQQFKRLRMTSTVIMLLLKELYDQGSQRITEDDDISIFTTPKRIDLTACIPDMLPMYDYQDEAIDQLRKYYLEDNKRAGILAMPTGSGKTRVATKFLLEHLIVQGWQVIWLTHRAMLIEQTADSFYTHAGSVLRSVSDKKEEFKMVCVSGSHATIRATEADDDLMIFGVQSLVRNLPFLQAVLKEKVMVVVDEAHHTLAPSYRMILQEIHRIGKDVRLLGLTATPSRLNDVDTARLMQIFDNKIIYSVPMSLLITRGFLSKPKYSRVDTQINFHTQITLDEQRYISKWGELAPETMERMALVAERNALIADTYVANATAYGKTLIFALNATHCLSLCEELQKRGVRCDYIYCAHPGNEEKIARFKRGDLDVLVNINVMTEGNDVPDIQTVFLTRPTSSDVLLMQMIGRGMRGLGSGGTETVNIVDFHDNWGSFANWLNPEFLIRTEMEMAEPEESTQSKRKPSQMVPWAMIRELLDGVRTSVATGDRLAAFSALPLGWYDVVDEDGNDSKVLVFESQISGFLSLWKNKESLSDANYTGQNARDDCFDAFGLMPSAKDLQLLLDLYRTTGEFPHLHQFTQRKAVDAALLAQKLKEENVGVADLEQRIAAVYEQYSETIDSLYGSLEHYEKRVLDFIHYPNGMKPLGVKIEELPEEELRLDRTPCYDLQDLTEEVVREMFTDFGHVPPISWTRRPMEGYFGQYTKWEDRDQIKINSLLNSPDVPRETVKYVIYHELLHRDNMTHDQAFRHLEHQYPNWTQHERFLDFTFPKFDIKYAI